MADIEPVDKGTYASGTTYAKNDIVHYEDQSWMSQVDSNTGNTPNAADAGAHWVAFASAGGADSNAEPFFLPTLPTSDPHQVGQVWNNSNVVNISAG